MRSKRGGICPIKGAESKRANQLKHGKPFRTCQHSEQREPRCRIANPQLSCLLHRPFASPAHRPKKAYAACRLTRSKVCCNRGKSHGMLIRKEERLRPTYSFITERTQSSCCETKMSTINPLIGTIPNSSDFASPSFLFPLRDTSPFCNNAPDQPEEMPQTS